MTCNHLVDSGVYVLGALSPAQRLEFETHMTSCAECRAEVNDLAVLPGLLGRLSEPTVVAAADLPTPSVLPKVLAKVHRQRRGRRILAGAAAIVIAVLALVAGLNMPSSSPRPSAAAPLSSPSATAPGFSSDPSPSAPAPVTLHPMLPVGNDEPVTAQVGFAAVPGGTQVVLKCQYPDSYGPPETGKKWFGLFAIPRNGKPAQEIGTWGSIPGEDVSIPATQTSWSIPQMTRVELRDATGHALLYYNF